MKKLAIKLINWYQRDISPNKRSKCRHHPTCSNYSLECYKRFNFFKASLLTIRRLLMCTPFFKPRYDPVPEKKIKIQKDTE